MGTWSTSSSFSSARLAIGLNLLSIAMSSALPSPKWMAWSQFYETVPAEVYGWSFIRTNLSL
jgi:hypothetical protein